MRRLAPRDAHRAAPVFAALEQHLAVPSALAGETPADLFVDDVAHPQVGLLLPSNRHRIYLAGVATPRVCIAVAQLLHQRYLPDPPVGHATQPPASFEAIIYCAPEAWVPALTERLAGVGTWEAERRYLRLRVGPGRSPSPVVPPAGFTLRRVEAAVWEDQSLSNREDLQAEVLSESPSTAEFLRRNWGYCVQRDAELAGWCLTEYTHAGRCELGVETLERHRRRGIGRASTSATLAHAAAHGVEEVGWHCWSANGASVGLAGALGFEEVSRYRVLCCRFDADGAGA